MNDKMLKFAIVSSLVNYVDNETPKRYFVSGHADLEDIEEFATLIVKECISRILRVGILEDIEIESDMIASAVAEHFGIE